MLILHALAISAYRLMKLKNQDLFVTHKRDRLTLEKATLDTIEDQYIVIHERTLYFYKNRTYYTLGVSKKEIEVKVVESEFGRKVGYLKREVAEPMLYNGIDMNSYFAVNKHNREVGFMEKRRTLDLFHLGHEQKGEETKETGEMRRAFLSRLKKRMSTLHPQDNLAKGDNDKQRDTGRNENNISDYNLHHVDIINQEQQKPEMPRMNSIQSNIGQPNTNMSNLVQSYMAQSNQGQTSLEQSNPTYNMPLSYSDGLGNHDSNQNSAPMYNIDNVVQYGSKQKFSDDPLPVDEQKKRSHVIESDSSMDDDYSLLFKDIIIKEVDSDYFQLAYDSICVTFYSDKFIFAPCSARNEKQFFTLVKSDDVFRDLKHVQEQENIVNIKGTGLSSPITITKTEDKVSTVTIIREETKKDAPINLDTPKEIEKSVNKSHITTEFKPSILKQTNVKINNVPSDNLDEPFGKGSGEDSLEDKSNFLANLENSFSLKGLDLGSID